MPALPAGARTAFARAGAHARRLRGRRRGGRRRPGDAAIALLGAASVPAASGRVEARCGGRPEAAESTRRRRPVPARAADRARAAGDRGGGMRIALEVNGAAARGRRRAAHAAVRPPAPRARPHRHQGRLRARRLRRLHRAGRRRGGALVPDARRAGARPVGAHDRGAGRRRLHPLQQAFHEAHALQCGFCTAGHPDVDRGVPARVPGAERGGDPRGAGRQPVPLHRLPRAGGGDARG